jgi:hypothetical protein
MHIPLPLKFEASAEVEDEFLTPPIWVAMNPPPMFERPTMTRTLSDASSLWEGEEDDNDDESSASSEQAESASEEQIQQVVVRMRS